MSLSERNTLRGSPVVAAPGKVFLIGEYAVLEGAPAVVAAVACLAVGQFVPGMEPGSPLVAEAVRAAHEGLGERARALPAGSVLVDSNAFQHGGHKVGLGSSAAVAAASVAAVLELAGLPIAPNKNLCFSLAERAHRTAQGGVGSGADVAAAVHGGIIRFRRPVGGFATIDRLQVPGALGLVVFAESTPAVTSDMIHAVKSFALANGAAYADLINRLSAQAEAFIAAFGAPGVVAAGGATPTTAMVAATAASAAAGAVNVAALIRAADAYGALLGELGARARAPIVTPRFELAAELAANMGGAAKPSGAGGGDLGVAFFAEPEAARAFGSRIPELGLRRVDLPLDTGGVHRRQPAGSQAIAASSDSSVT